MRAALCALACAALMGATAQAGLTTELVASGLTAPVFLTGAPNDESRLFVLERAGVIKIIQTSDGSVLPTPFLDFSSLVDTNGTRAANGFVFHPDYAGNGFLFVYYCDLQNQTVLARYRVSDTDPNVADPASATILLTLEQPGLPHSGGNPVFRPGDPDHYLYLPKGDGGVTENVAQDVTSGAGAILRIDVDLGPGPDTATPFPAPGNPWDDGAGPNNDLLWAKGLRNPWRVSFDRLTGDLYIGDCGEHFREEVDFIGAGSPGGQNFGWRFLEGTADMECVGSQCDRFRATTQLPIYEYEHSVSTSTVIGGYVYRGVDIPDLQGQYLFADLLGSVFSFVFDPSMPSEIGVNPSQLRDLTPTLNRRRDNIVSFGEDTRGELYIVHLSGSVFKIVEGSVSSSGGCFIATAAYGSPMAAQLDVLRAFRDRYLLRQWTGIPLVSAYYRISPPLADWIAVSESRRLTARVVLAPMVFLVACFMASPLLVSALGAGLGLVLIELFRRARRRWDSPV
jgi:hypothetical protein